MAEQHTHCLCNSKTHLCESFFSQSLNSMYIVSCDGLEIEKATSRMNKDESFGVERLVSTFYLVLFLFLSIGLAFNSLCYSH